MTMRRNGSKSRSRAFSSLRSYGFSASELSNHSPMLFVDLLTRPGHQGEVLRDPRLRHRLRISITLLLRQHVFHSCCSMQYLRWVGRGIHTIKIRPIYHWTPQRVRAHIAICYMAFCCLQHLRNRLKMLGHPMSPARIRKELNAVQLSILHRKGTGERYAMPSPVTTDAKRILTCVGLTWNEAPFRMPPERTHKTDRTKG